MLKRAAAALAACWLGAGVARAHEVTCERALRTCAPDASSCADTTLLDVHAYPVTFSHVAFIHAIHPVDPSTVGAVDTAVPFSFTVDGAPVTLPFVLQAGQTAEAVSDPELIASYADCRARFGDAALPDGAEVRSDAPMVVVTGALDGEAGNVAGCTPRLVCWPDAAATATVQGVSR
jgi:hypothetical protein